MKAQMKAANRSGAAAAVIVGQDEASAGAVTVRDLRSGTGQTTIPRTELGDHLRRLLDTPHGTEPPS